MKRFRILILFIIPGIFNSAISFGDDNSKTWPFFQSCQPHRSLQVMAHRGAAMAAPENTIPAIALAAELGFEWVEIDVRLTQDGHHVLLHDSALDGKTNGKGEVANMTLEAIQKLDAGSWFAARFAGLRVPTLDEALAFAKGKINFYIDCKKTDPKLLVQEISRRQMENQVAVYGDVEFIKSIRSLSNGSIPVMAKCHNEEELKTLAESIQPAIVEVNAEDLTKVLVEAAHRAGILVQVKALDNDDRPEVWMDCLEKGADFVQTDYPDRVQAAYFHRVVSKPACWISAHRGVKILAPENTLPAYVKAIDLGCDFMEIDVHTSSDGKLILMHDSEADRTTPLKGALSNFTFEMLRSVSAGAWFADRFRDEKIPTLAEALQTAKGRIRIYLDNKETQPKPLMDELNRFDFADNVAIYGGNFDEMAKLQALKPDIKLMPPLHKAENLPEIAKRVKPYALDVSWNILSSQLIADCHKLGIKVFSDAMGDHEKIDDYLQAIGWGIDLIQTDNPLLVQRALEIAAAKN